MNEKDRQKKNVVFETPEHFCGFVAKCEQQ